MIRMAGFLLGVCLTVAVLLYVLQPELLPRDEDVQAGAATPPAQLSATIQLADRQPAVKSPEPAKPAGEEPPISAVFTAESLQGVSDSEAGPDTLPDGRTAVNETAVNQDALPAEVTADTLQGVTATATDPYSLPQDMHGIETVVTEDHLADSQYVFWTAFRSRWAAEGFAGRLTRVTEVPVEVVDTGSGTYRVGFSYRHEAERLVRVERIETVTGFELE
jgi:hypothetical protein